MATEDDLKAAKCRSKIAYESMTDARVAARAANDRRRRRNTEQGPKADAYHCEQCGKFHLGRDFKGWNRDRVEREHHK